MFRILIISLIITASITFYSCDNKSNPVKNKIDTTQNNEGNARITFDKNSGSPGNSINVSVTGIVLGKDSAKIYFGDIQVKIHSSNYFQEETRFYVKIPDSLAKMSKVIFICGDIKGTSKDYFYFYNPKKIKILSFFPEKGSVGSTVIIRADNINPLKHQNSVYFGEKQALIDSIYIFNSYDYIITKVPENANTDYLKLIVDKNEVISAKIFKILDRSNVDSLKTKQVIIYDFSPKNGEPESEFSIYAKNINPDINKNTVYVNNVKAKILSLYPPNKPEVIFAKIPKNATTGKIKLVSGIYSDETLEDFYVISKDIDFSISDFQPKKGLVGLDVYIYGNGFGNNMNNVKILFGDIEAPKTSINDTLITCIVPCFAKPSQISVIKNNQKITTDDVFIPSHFYSLQVELANMKIKYGHDKRTTLFFIPMDEITQNIDNNPYFGPYYFGDYQLKIDRNNKTASIVLDTIFTTTDVGPDGLPDLYRQLQYQLIISNLDYNQIENSKEYSLFISKDNIFRYLTAIKYKKWDTNYSNTYKKLMDYLDWRDPYTDSSYIKITIKRCP
ncbi:MAG: hypothetical protein GXO79_04565 [Chlorobi bacterium]|nr:hypothetical protein [Chlorobiota bacterium]